MRTKYFLLAAAMIALPAAAQETYEEAKLSDQDLNGTARYVGMGGAMEALGADLSTISSNPAGIGLFRHSTINATGSIVSQSSLPGFADGSKTHASFDQLGGVYTMRTRKNSYLNFAFNYHKSKNFDFILAAAGALDNASQNKLTYQKYRNDVFTDDKDLSYSIVDALYMNNLLYDNATEAYYNYPAQSYQMNREHKGYIGSYDFNISGNIHDRVFLGLTFGLEDVNYKHDGTYTENLGGGTISVNDRRKIDGTGFNVKGGIIVRPISNSPFRIGAYVETPTWYDLTTKNYTTLAVGQTYADDGTNVGESTGKPTNTIAEAYDFKFRTPWKFGLSLGHTVGNFLALGLTYEYADYAGINTRINDGYDWYGYETTSADEAMNDNTDRSLKGVSTVKFGLEYKPVQEFAIRLGYNYVSPKYDEDGFKDASLYSPGVYYASTTDYTNWKSTNRFTVGLGYQVKNFSIDVAYQLSCQKGDFYPFTSYYDGDDAAENNIADAQEVKNNRNQFILTLGYHF